MADDPIDVHSREHVDAHSREHVDAHSAEHLDVDSPDPFDADSPEHFEVHSPEHFKALAHPLRQRLLFALAQPATVSQLAVTLSSHKGNIAHHLKVLREAGLITPAGTRQVRGGTEQYYQRVARILHFAGEHSAANLPVTFRAIADEIASAAPDPFLVLRTIRLTQDQAGQVIATLTELAHGTEEAGEDQPRYGMLLGLYRQASPAGIQ
jgi:DNA-binding transcriptional ArsR family regulator